jgi:hypothetical protein
MARGLPRRAGPDSQAARKPQSGGTVRVLYAVKSMARGLPRRASPDSQAARKPQPDGTVRVFML